jgi:phage terminase large subunit-like protein
LQGNLSSHSAPGKSTKKSKTKTRAERNIKWIEDHCCVPEGRDVGKRVQLRPWQREEIIKIYDNPHGTRRVILSFGRKNGKTAFASFLLLLHLAGPEHMINSQLYSAAQSREQAAILFGLAAKVVRLSPSLSAYVLVRDTAKELVCRELGTRYKALSAEASTAYGLAPAFIVHDELGQVHGPRFELYEALETATATQENPLSLVISTQAPTDSDLLSILIDDALQGNDPRVVVSLYSAPMEDEPFDEETIRKANPAFGDFQNANEVLAMAQDAKRMPSREAEYRNLILNQRVEASSPFVSKIVWDACSAPVADLTKVPCYAGLDLSETQDLTAFVMVGKVAGKWQVHPTFWLPHDTLHDRARADRLPYDVWHRQGFLRTVPGRSVDYEHVAAFLFETCRAYDVKKIAFDRWNFLHLRPWLLKSGFTDQQVQDKFIEFGQGFKDMSPALRALEVEVLNARINHGGHPVLGMCAANAVVQTDPAGSKKLAKNKSSGRIDGMVALAMAMGSVPHEGHAEDKKFQMFFVGGRS